MHEKKQTNWNVVLQRMTVELADVTVSAESAEAAARHMNTLIRSDESEAFLQGQGWYTHNQYDEVLADIIEEADENAKPTITVPPPVDDATVNHSVELLMRHVAGSPELERALDIVLMKSNRFVLWPFKQGS